MPVEYAQVYYQRGPAPKGSGLRFGISDPPTCGHSRAFIIRGEKRSTVFCPFNLESSQVPNDAAEITLSKPIEMDREKMARIVTDRWAHFAGLGFQRAYDVAALVLTELGAEVPKIVPVIEEGEEPKSRGGKEVNPEALRSVRRESKRGAVAEFFLAEEPQSVREAMARLGLTRSGVLSHLFCLNRDHGLGYELIGDCARLVVPEGFDPFAVTEQRAERTERSEGTEASPDDDPAASSEPPRSRKPQGKPVNPAALKAIPEPSKRADVARFFLDWASLDEAMGKFELTRSAVLSMLYQIWKDNGLGHEVDGERARLLVPEGHVVFGEKQPRKKKEG